MLKKKSVYKCNVCGNLVEALWNGDPSISCCGQEMEELSPKTADSATEKHVPVIEKDGNKVTVKVGSVPHPMQPDHYILFVELLVGDKVYRHDFKEGDTKAEAVFTVEDPSAPMKAREYCNKHSLWASA